MKSSFQRYVFLYLFAKQNILAGPAVSKSVICIQGPNIVTSDAAPKFSDRENY